MNWNKLFSLFSNYNMTEKSTSPYVDWSEVQLLLALTKEKNQYEPDALKLIEEELIHRSLPKVKLKDSLTGKKDDNNLSPKWVALLSSSLSPKGKKQINELEAIRKSFEVSHEEFAFVLLGRPASTKKVQYEIYQGLRTLYPDWSEKQILREVLISRKETAEQYDDKWLSDKGDFEYIFENIDTIEDLCSVIIEHERNKEGVDLTGYVRNEIDKILEWEPPIRKRKNKST